METSFFGSLWRMLKAVVLSLAVYVCMHLLVMGGGLLGMALPALFRGTIRADGVANLMVAGGFVAVSAFTLRYAVPALWLLAREPQKQVVWVPMLLTVALVGYIAVMLLSSILFRWPLVADAIPLWVAETRDQRVFYASIATAVLIALLGYFASYRMKHRK